MPQSLDDISRRFAHASCVSFRQANELLALDIRSSAATATVLLQGAQLIGFTPLGEQALIWHSPLASYRRGASSRGGIPICWPWFGDAARNPAAVRAPLTAGALPAHGFVRSLDWQLDDIREHGDAVVVTLSLTLDANTPSPWPFAARLQVTHRIGRVLETRLHVKNRDTRVFAFSAALHTYFAVGAIDAVTIGGFDSTRYIDALDDWALKTQRGDISVDREVDRIYLDIPARSVIHDARWQRDIVVDAIGSRSAVVWNPWIDKAKRLSDFAAQDYRAMLCIETANVMDDAVTLAPGATHELGVRIQSLPNAS